MNWPAAFEHRIAHQFGNQADSLLGSLQNAPVTSILLNPFKPSGRFGSEKHVPWNEWGRILAQRPSFTLDPLLHAGCYYVQESSSMFLEFAIRSLFGDRRDLRCLDLCAAPGGKSLNILSHLRGEGLLVSNELIRTRNPVLRENLCKWGSANVVVTQNDPAAFSSLEGFFDLIVVDAPCSGEGLFRRDPMAAEQWSENNVLLCASRQRRILADIVPALAPGGVLLYSTCTFSPQENEDNMRWLGQDHGLDPVSLAADPTWGIDQLAADPGTGYRFLPHRVPGEGYCLSAWRKDDGRGFKSARTSNGWYRPLPLPEKRILEGWTGAEAVADGHGAIRLCAAVAPLLNQLAKHLVITAAGLEGGTIRQGQLAPGHGLAMSHFLNPEIPSADLTEEEALAYLRHEMFHPENSMLGWVLARYEGQSLGWFKSMPQRINNYYPKDWRIRMAKN